MDIENLLRAQAGVRADAAGHIGRRLAGQEMVHLKSGGTYTIIACAAHESNGGCLVIYQAEDGKVWARSQSEFFDGRFVSAQDYLDGDIP